MNKIKASMKNWNNKTIETDAYISSFMAGCGSCGAEFNFANTKTDNELICRCPECGQRIKLRAYFD